MLVKPWIMSQFGVEGQLETVVPAKLIDDLKATKDCHTLRRIFVYSQEGELVASVKTHQGSGNLHSMVAANALTFLPPGSTAKCGETISVILL
jgi:molybdopterin biosynthesis enzyme